MPPAVGLVQTFCEQMNLNRKNLLLSFVQASVKEVEVPNLEICGFKNQKKERTELKESPCDNRPRRYAGAYKGKNLQLQNHSLIFVLKNISLI